MPTKYDILIIGGGMVGASLARAMSGQGVTIGVVEACPFDSAAQSSYDDRVIALSWGSRLIMQGMGLWDALAPDAQPINHIHVSDRGHFGFTRLHAGEEGVEALGYVVTARALGRVLLAGLDRIAGVDLICPAGLKSLFSGEDGVEVNLEAAGERRTLSGALLVAADGDESEARRLLAIPVKERSYGQTAIIANITPGIPHGGVAYERFTDSGPLAVLPMTGGRCSLVWTAREAEAPSLMELSDAEFLQRLQQRFGYRLGRLERIGRRIAYPLRLRQARTQVRSHAVIIGNASHTIHPVAGQGFNLGLRDVAVLADILTDANRAGSDPGAAEHLQRYEKWRRQDQNRVVMMTDGLARVFVNPLAPLRLARNLGLLGLDLAPVLKHQVARQFMGLQGRLPRLARGIPLV